MDSASSVPSPEDLLAHADFLRALARNLLADDAAAEDVVQQAWVAALEQRPAVGNGLRPWLATVVRNLSLRTRRSRARCSRRERAAARAEAQASVADAVSRLETHQRLVAAVLELEERYREIVVLRFFEDLSPREIAEKLEVPVNTVYSRLQRGRAQLRAALAERYGGDHRAWCLALLPVAGLTPEPAPVTLAAGALIVSAKKVALAAVLILLLIVTALSTGLLSPSVRPERLPAQPLGGAGVADAEGPGERIGAATREARADFDVDRELDLHGRVVDPSGRPIPGARLETFRRPWERANVLRAHAHELAVSGPAAVADGEGRFALRLRLGEIVSLRARAPGFASAEYSSLQSGERIRVVLRPAVTLKVRVVEPAGLPLPGALVTVSRPKHWEGTRFLDERETDETGTALFELPGASAFRISARHPRYGSPLAERRDLTALGSTEHEIRLPRGRTLFGVVVDADRGAPIAGARVGLGWPVARSVVTDQHGRYTFYGWTGVGHRDLHVDAPEYGRAMKLVAEKDEIDFRLERGDVTRGRLLDRRGRAVPGACVSAIGAMPDQGWSLVSLRHAESNVGGHFELRGLSRRMPHMLVVTAPGHGRLNLEIEPAPRKGAPIELGDLILPVPTVLSGRVLSAEGEPVPRVSVEITGTNEDIRRLRASDAQPAADYGNAERRHTDDLGRFRFPDLPPGRYTFVARARDGREATRELSLGPQGERLELRLPSVEHWITVNLRDDRGIAVSGALIEVTSSFGSHRGWTDDSGQARIAVSGAPQGVQVGWLPVLGRPLQKPAPVALDGREEVSLVAQTSTIVTGTVVDPKGALLPRAQIQVRRPGRPTRVVSADDSGHFEINVSMDEPVDLVFLGEVETRIPGPLDFDFKTRLVPYEGELRRVSAGDRNLEWRLRDLEGRRLRARVLDPEGQPLSGVGVSALYDGVVVGAADTDRRGLAELTNLPAADLEIRVDAQDPAKGWLRPDAVVAARGQTIALEFRRGTRVHGTVVDARGVPVPGALVRVHFGGELRETIFTRSGQDGGFSVAVDLGGESRVRLEAQDLRRGRQDHVAALADIDPTADAVRIVLRQTPSKDEGETGRSSPASR